MSIAPQKTVGELVSLGVSVPGVIEKERMFYQEEQEGHEGKTRLGSAGSLLKYSKTKDA